MANTKWNKYIFYSKSTKSLILTLALLGMTKIIFPQLSVKIVNFKYNKLFSGLMVFGY